MKGKHQGLGGIRGWRAWLNIKGYKELICNRCGHSGNGMPGLGAWGKVVVLERSRVQPLLQPTCVRWSCAC